MRGRIWIPVLIVSIIVMIVGISLGEAGFVLEKAVNVCLSCIGIG